MDKELMDKLRALSQQRKTEVGLPEQSQLENYEDEEMESLREPAVIPEKSEDELNKEAIMRKLGVGESESPDMVGEPEMESSELPNKEVKFEALKQLIEKMRK